MNVTRTSACRSNGRLPGTGTHRDADRALARLRAQQRYLRSASRSRGLGCGQRSREAGPGARWRRAIRRRAPKERPQGRKRTCTQPVEKPVDHMWGLARDEQSMSEADLAEVWARSLDELAEMHIEPAQRAWLQLTRPLGLVENTALIATPNEFVKEQLETRLRSLITNALSRELGRSIQLAVTVDPAATGTQAPPNRPGAPTSPPDARPAPPADGHPMSAAEP